jgi:hypothetical protein
MADQAHLDIFKEGVEAWNEWRTHNPSITPDLSSANFSGSNLSGANLSRVRLSGSDLTRANLSEADLSGADLSHANLTAADLSEANLSAATMLTQHQINRAKGDEKTQLPKGLKRPAVWSQPK